METAEERIKTVLRAAGKAEAIVVREVVRTPADAERLAFTGSPTILVDGRDPFAEPGAAAALACRLYTTPYGREGAPSIEQLTEAIQGG